jgi:hypothetical protein
MPMAVVLASSAGRERNEPPPAMVLSTPARNDAEGSQDA